MKECIPLLKTLWKCVQVGVFVYEKELLVDCVLRVSKGGCVSGNSLGDGVLRFHRPLMHSLLTGFSIRPEVFLGRF